MPIFSLTWAGPALAALDTETKPAPEAGAAAMVEGSNLFNQSGADALQQLTDVLLPNVGGPQLDK